MANCYAEFYAARPQKAKRTLCAQYVTLADNHSADWFLGAVSRPSDPVVMAYLGRDEEVHVIHRIQEHIASLEHRSPRFEGNFIGLMDEIGDFGANLGTVCPSKTWW
jgi:hypothetical protein